MAEKYIETMREINFFVKNDTILTFIILWKIYKIIGHKCSTLQCN